jgi:hypothetical protein
VSFRQTAAAMLAITTAIVAPANAQMQQISVKVDDKDYTVTEMRGGRAGHMVQLAGPEGAAMVMVNNDNKITAYISPPGGGGQQDLINKVWAAYLEKKAATAPVVSTSAPEPADPHAALRAQTAAITAGVQGRGNGVTTVAPDQRVVKSVNDASIVIFDPKLGTDVTITDNLMKATWTITPKVPQGMPVSAKPENFEAFFEGGDKPASDGKKAGKFLGSGAIATLDSENTRADAASSISVNPDKAWRVNEQEGKIKKNVYESGGMRVSAYQAYTGRDPGGCRGKVYWSR